MNIQEQNPQSPTASSTAPLQRSSPKIAILHDAFLYRGGGERLVTLMAKSLDADLISGFFSEGSFDPRELGFEGRMIPLGKPVFAKGIRHTILKYRFQHKTQFLSEYDIVIFSGNCLDAVKNLPATTKKIYYCHTPPRYIFDLRAQYLSQIPGWLHGLINTLLDHQAKGYIEQLEGIDTIFTNSQNTHDRLLSYCHKESTILYPPTDTSRFVPDESVVSLSDMPSEYFLSCSRLSPPKRVDIVVRAFLDMPEYNLVFTYGANDPQREYILGLAKGSKNIFPIPAPRDEDFISLLAHATANIYIPVDEDFGMTPVESMACGVPVLGVREGGLLETVLDGETGKLIDIEDTASGIHNLQRVIQETSTEEWKDMGKNSRNRALDFSLERFAEQLKKQIG